MKPMVEVSQAAPRFTAIFYGPPKVGKTELAKTAQFHEQMADVLFIDLDKRLISDIPGIKAIPVDNSVEMEEVIVALTSDSTEYDSIKTVVVDSLTKWLSREQDALGLAGMDRNRKSQYNRDEMQMKDWGILTSKVTRLMGNLIDDERRHVIMNAHKRNFYADDKQKVILRRTFDANDRLVNKLASMFNNIWALQRDNGTIDILTQPVKQYLAGTSGNRFPVELGEKISCVGRRDKENNLILEPNLSDIFNLYIESEYTKE